MQRGKRALLTLIVASVALLTNRTARADWDLQLATMMGGGWLKETPTMTSDYVATSARSIRGSDVRTHGGLGMFGMGLDTELTIDDRWKVPLLGGDMWWAMGDYDREVTSLDGSIAYARPWTTFRGDLLLPGLGRRFKYRREMVGIAIRTGYTWMKMDGSVASGVDTKAINLGSSSFLLQAEIEGCRRLDPSTRVCLSVAPRLYEYKWLNGVNFGLRVEWGR